MLLSGVESCVVGAEDVDLGSAEDGFERQFEEEFGGRGKECA